MDSEGNNLIIYTIKVNGIEGFTLIDFGASLSFVSVGINCTDDKKIDNEKLKFVLADGNSNDSDKR